MSQYLTKRVNNAMRFVPPYQAEQPELVATLCRDWSESMACFRVLARFPTWPRHSLRTPRLLERVNQMFWRLLRVALAFQSASGLRRQWLVS